MTSSQSASFELGRMPVEWLVATVFAPLRQLEFAVLRHGIINMFGVASPVGRDMESTTRGQTVCCKAQEGRLHDAAFMMPLLWPWVREQQVNPDQCSRADLVTQDLHSVVGDDAQVADAGVASHEHAVADTRFVHLDADKVEFRALHGSLHEGVTIAETDFEYPTGTAPEQLIEIDQVIAEVDAVYRPQFLKRPFL